MTEALLAIDGLTRASAAWLASDAVTLAVPAGETARHHRPERCRQDNADRRTRRRDKARRRPHPFCRP